MVIPNNTHYYNESTRTHNCVPDTNSFLYQSNRRLGYQQRLYFEYLYTQKVKGQIFFYTFTYNDRNIPKFLGHNCFNYEHIRYITNGKLPKILNRQYGTRLRYFCSCESGDGKGKRGKGNNPHYHFIFFLQPLHDKSNNPLFDSYKPISPFLFRDLLRQLWHGTTGYIDWRNSKFGHVEDGKNFGIVQSPDCFKYVSKYVTKESDEVKFESVVCAHYREYAINNFLSFESVYDYYKYLRFFHHRTKEEFVKDFNLIGFNHNRKNHTDYFTIEYWLKNYCGDVGLTVFQHYEDWYFNKYIPMFVDYMLSQYRCKYSSKPRCSKSLGFYGLNFIKDVSSNPHFVIPGKNKYNIQIPALYYIRKLFYNVSICSVTGNPIYRLNDLGIQYKCATLKRSIDIFSSNLRQLVSYSCLNNIKHEFSGLSSDDVIKYFNSSDIDLYNLFSVYHFVYEYRSFDTSKSYSITSFNDVLFDYKSFLSSDCTLTDYNSNYIRRIVNHNTVSFDSHPVFIEHIRYFKFMNDFIDHFSGLRSDAKKEEFKSSFEYVKKLNMYNFNRLS